MTSSLSFPLSERLYSVLVSEGASSLALALPSCARVPAGSPPSSLCCFPALNPLTALLGLFFVCGSQWFDYDVSGKEFALSLPSLECTELLESGNARLLADLGYFFKYVLYALPPPLELCVQRLSVPSFSRLPACPCRRATLPLSSRLSMGVMSNTAA